MADDQCSEDYVLSSRPHRVLIIQIPELMTTQLSTPSLL